MDTSRSAQWGSVSARIAPSRSVRQRAYDRVTSFLESGNLSYERNFLIVRPAIAALVAVAVIFQGSGIPGRTAVFLGCGAAVTYNFGFAYLVSRKRIYVLRVASLVADNLVVMITALFVFYRMGRVGYETDLWLIFLCLIVTNSLYYGPIGSLLFTSLWTATFVIISELFYGRDTYFRSELPMRLVFFVLTGFVSISLSAELRARRDGLEQKTRQTLSMLATIVEARDVDAGLHLHHIQFYSRALALRMGLTGATANEIAYAAMIHDVGKAQVADAVLKKPGPLTVNERREMQRHTVWGDAILSENEEFSTARQVARWHHERWDGTGYPDGLIGEQIPLAARIVAVADVYDALISERPYKRAWRADEAIAEIEELRETHFDPAVVDAFIDLYDSGLLADLEAEMRSLGERDELAAHGYAAAA